MKILLAGLILITIVSCKSRPDPNSSRETPVDSAISASPVEENPVREEITDESQSNREMPDTFRVAVVMYSIGAGTDPSVKEKLDTFLRQYNDSHQNQVSYTAVPWGREGEVDFGFTLSGLNAEEQKAFVNQLYEMYKGQDLVHVEENKPNKSRR